MLDKQFTISYSPKEERTVSRLAEQLYYEDLNNIEGIEKNTIAFKTMYIFELADKVEVKVFIINSSDNKVNFEYLPFQVINEEGEVIISEVLKLEDVGEIPAKHARPYSLFFSRDNIVSGKKVDDKCKLVIEAKDIVTKESKRVSIGYMDEKISLYEKRVIEKYVECIPPIIKEDIKLIPYKSGIDEENRYYLILVVANASYKSVKLSDFRIIYRDQTGMIQAHKRISSLPEAKPNSSSIYKINFEPADIMRESFSPEKCRLMIK